ncbi:GspH/FimT family pseudopilin [Psychromonas arctica]|uniref:GspH/FimT family pseudopilin n=1 Tax=Psychromonas arctica TaxID=168275 RepID=UPI0003FF4DCA|nr:GspH/FimT family pseudopilin [Psychromonas arctica]
MTHFHDHGFTFIELIITLAILGVIISISTASYQGILANQTLLSRTSEVYYTLQLAKVEAIKRNQKIYVNFCQQGNIWKMGISDTNQCDCFSTNSCQLDGVEKVQDLADGKTIFIDSSTLTFTGTQASYGALRFSVETGTVTITNSEQHSLSIIQSAMRLRVCALAQAQLGHKKC